MKKVSLAMVVCLSLNAGWELKSSKVDITDMSNLDNRDIKSIFVFRQGEYLAYYPKDSTSKGTNTLSEIKVGEGFWVNVGKTVFNISSLETNPAWDLNKSITKGWNLLGVIKNSSKNLFTPKVSSLWIFENGAYKGLNDIDFLRPRVGFWVNAKENFTINQDGRLYLKVVDSAYKTPIYGVSGDNKLSNYFGVIPFELTASKEITLVKDGYKSLNIKVSDDTQTAENYITKDGFIVAELTKSVTDEILTDPREYEMPFFIEDTFDIKPVYVPAGITSSDEKLQISFTKNLKLSNSKTLIIEHLDKSLFNLDGEFIDGLTIKVKDIHGHDSSFETHEYIAIKPSAKIDSSTDIEKLYWFYKDDNNKWKPFSKVSLTKSGYGGIFFESRPNFIFCYTPSSRIAYIKCQIIILFCSNTTNIVATTTTLTIDVCIATVEIHTPCRACIVCIGS